MSLNLYPASKSQNITIFWIKKMFWKQKNRIYVKIILFCVYIIVLESCNLAACVALEFCSEFLQAWFFSSIFRRYCALKGGAQKGTPVPTVFLGSVCQQCFLCKLKWFIQYRFFYWLFLFVCKTMQNLRAVWIIRSISFSFNIWLSFMD